MALKFNSYGQAENPTFVLSKRNGDKIGVLSGLESLIILGSLTHPEISFSVNKYNNATITPYWNEIVDFKLVYCKELDTWFEIKISENLSSNISKSVTLQRLGEAELSQIIIRHLEVNTEDDILREDYVQPTVFYNEEKPEASLLHRLLDKASHYVVEHVDEHLKGIQRVFSFNGNSITECFDKISEDMDVLIVYNSNATSNGNPNRGISVYDLKNYCRDCGARGTFEHTCLNCGSTNITYGYGEDTTIYVSSDCLGNDINISVNQEAVKNCFYVEAGDELMTATVRNCNPNGTSYIWNPGTNIEDMDITLQNLLREYFIDYDYYKDSYVTSTATLPVSQYNDLVQKYNGTSEYINLSQVANELVGYSPIMQHYYDAVYLQVYLNSGLLPSIVLQDTNAAEQASKLTADALSPVAVIDNKYITLSNVSTAALNAAKITADPRYKITVKQSSLNGNVWTGNFTVTNFSDERDTYDSEIINIQVNSNYQVYINQKLKKALYNGMKGKNGSISDMLDMTDEEFSTQLKKYNLISLNSFNTCFTDCLKILSEQGIDKPSSDLYVSIYLPVYQKLSIIQSEVSMRESEVEIAVEMQDKLLDLKKFINDKLDLEKYLGKELWLDFCTYRREGTFTNSNYISDYLTNSQLFSSANELLNLAQYEIHKVSTYTHTIDSTLKNLLSIKEFEPLVQYFECGNWIRVIDDDNNIYKLRLLDYEISYNDLNNISVSFSEAIRKIDSLAPVKEILINSSNIINNYNAAMNKTNSNFEVINDSMKDVVKDSSFNYEYIYDSSSELKDDIAQTKNSLSTDILVVDGLIQTEVSERVAGENLLYSTITQTANSILTEVEDVDNNLSSRISQTVNGISMSVGNGETSSSITLSINKENGDTEEATGTINMTGLVSFTDLSTEGQTTIHGGNIETGTITADKIEAGAITSDKIKADAITADKIEAGAITWGKLDSDDMTSNITTITESTISTTSIEAKNLKVDAVNVAGELTAATIKASAISGRDETLFVSEAHFGVLKVLDIDWTYTNVGSTLFYLKNSVSSLESKISLLQSDISSLQSDISSLETRMASLEARVSALEP